MIALGRKKKNRREQQGGSLCATRSGELLTSGSPDQPDGLFTVTSRGQEVVQSCFEEISSLTFLLSWDNLNDLLDSSKKNHTF